MLLVKKDGLPVGMWSVIFIVQFTQIVFELYRISLPIISPSIRTTTKYKRGGGVKNVCWLCWDCISDGDGVDFTVSEIATFRKRALDSWKIWNMCTVLLEKTNFYTYIITEFNLIDNHYWKRNLGGRWFIILIINSNKTLVAYTLHSLYNIHDYMYVL